MSAVEDIGIWADTEQTFIDTMAQFGLYRPDSETFHPQLLVSGPFQIPAAPLVEDTPPTMIAGLFWNLRAWGELAETLRTHPVLGTKYEQEFVPDPEVPDKKAKKPVLDRTRLADAAKPAGGTRGVKGAVGDAKRPARLKIGAFEAYDLNPETTEIKTPANMWA